MIAHPIAGYAMLLTEFTRAAIKVELAGAFRDSISRLGTTDVIVAVIFVGWNTEGQVGTGGQKDDYDERCCRGHDHRKYLVQYLGVSY